MLGVRVVENQREINWIKKALADKVEDVEAIDFEMEYDAQKSYQENKDYFLKKYGKATEQDLTKLGRKYNIEEQQKITEHLKEVSEQAEQVKNEALSNLTVDGDGSSNINPRYSEVFNNIRVLINSNTKYKGLIIIGKPALGKSYMTIQALNELGLKAGQDYIVVSGYITPLRLYQVVYENKTKIIIFDDCRGIMENINAISLMMSMLWNATGTRVVHYNSASSKLEIPPTFIFEGKMILLVNDIPNQLEALISRCIVDELIYTKEEILTMIDKIAEARQVSEVAQYIRKHSKGVDVNLRTLDLACDYYITYKEKDGLWKKMLGNMLCPDKRILYIEEMMEMNIEVSEQVRRFIKQFGQSRKTYFRLKSGLI